MDLLSVSFIHEQVRSGSLTVPFRERRFGFRGLGFAGMSGSWRRALIARNVFEDQPYTVIDTVTLCQCLSAWERYPGS